MQVSRQNMLTGEVNTMELDVTNEQLERWQAGELIQRVMPQLSATEREFLISGLTPEQQKEIFG